MLTIIIITVLVIAVGIFIVKFAKHNPNKMKKTDELIDVGKVKAQSELDKLRKK